MIEGLVWMDRTASLEKGVGISLRTFQHVKEAPDRPLGPEQSGRTWKFAEILARATTVPGSREEAEHWLERPAVGLSQQRPIDLPATPAGMRLVEDFLARIEYRVYACLRCPGALSGADLVVWRLDDARCSAPWDSGEGAWRSGGRSNSRGVRAFYCSIDPAVAILEVAVHKGFRALDMVPDVLTAATVIDPSRVHVVLPGDAPNPNRLRPGLPGGGQQVFGDGLLAEHGFVLIPSTVSTDSWKLIFTAVPAAGMYVLRSQEGFALNTRLHPPARP